MSLPSRLLASAPKKSRSCSSYVVPPGGQLRTSWRIQHGHQMPADGRARASASAIQQKAADACDACPAPTAPAAPLPILLPGTGWDSMAFIAMPGLPYAHTCIMRNIEQASQLLQHQQHHLISPMHQLHTAACASSPVPAAWGGGLAPRPLIVISHPDCCLGADGCQALPAGVAVGARNGDVPHLARPPRVLLAVPVHAGLWHLQQHASCGFCRASMQQCSSSTLPRLVVPARSCLVWPPEHATQAFVQICEPGAGASHAGCQSKPWTFISIDQQTSARMWMGQHLACMLHDEICLRGALVAVSLPQDVHHDAACSHSHSDTCMVMQHMHSTGPQGLGTQTQPDNLTAQSRHGKQACSADAGDERAHITSAAHAAMHAWRLPNARVLPGASP